MCNINTPEKELTGYPSIDKPWLKYYSEEAINAPLPECTVYEIYISTTKIAYLGYTAVLIDASLPNKEINKLIDFSDVCSVFTIAQIHEAINKSLLENIPVFSICEDFTYHLLGNSIKHNNKTPIVPTNENVIAIVFHQEPQIQ